MKSFMRVEDVAEELGISKSYAYKIVQRLNDELKEQGYITISGRVFLQACLLWRITESEGINYVRVQKY